MTKIMFKMFKLLKLIIYFFLNLNKNLQLINIILTMVDIDNSIKDEKEQTLDNDNDKKLYKTKDYVRRANNKYRKNKYNNDPEFREKCLESTRNSKIKYNEKYKEQKRNYMREYRARKKAEKIINENTITNTIVNDMTNLSINLKHSN